MSSFNEVFAAKVKRVTSPDGNITVVLTGGSVTQADFAAGAYSRYREPELERQLMALIRLVIVARQRSRREALVEVMGRGPAEVQPSEKDLRYRRILKDVVGEGHGARVSVYAVPNGIWEVQIAPDSLRDIRGSEFLADWLHAAETALAHMRRQIQDARSEVYGHISGMGVLKR